MKRIRKALEMEMVKFEPGNVLPCCSLISHMETLGALRAVLALKSLSPNYLLSLLPEGLFF